LDKKKSRSVGILDYADSLRPNYEAWKRVSLKGDTITLEKAYSLAEKIDRLSNVHNTKVNPNWLKPNESTSKWNSNSLPDEREPYSKLKSMVCFYCLEKRHYQSDCPKLKRIIEGNKKNIFSHKPLN